ncbi:hypothetical protein AGLY_009798 [Aphis glycines]|uniref:Uncharacterized protein n=1 Tax=Aphis glycines TaxID=307491 RepID=A0A6G0TGV4_APHGL|nr:hypothetical protein AGLY_009798 [Aphis glycines]
MLLIFVVVVVVVAFKLNEFSLYLIALINYRVTCNGQYEGGYYNITLRRSHRNQFWTLGIFLPRRPYTDVCLATKGIRDGSIQPQLCLSFTVRMQLDLITTIYRTNLIILLFRSTNVVFFKRLLQRNTHITYLRHIYYSIVINLKLYTHIDKIFWRFNVRVLIVDVTNDNLTLRTYIITQSCIITTNNRLQCSLVHNYIHTAILRRIIETLRRKSVRSGNRTTSRISPSNDLKQKPNKSHTDCIALYTAVQCTFIVTCCNSYYAQTARPQRLQFSQTDITAIAAATRGEKARAHTPRVPSENCRVTRNNAFRFYDDGGGNNNITYYCAQYNNNNKIKAARHTEIRHDADNRNGFRFDRFR